MFPNDSSGLAVDPSGNVYVGGPSADFEVTSIVSTAPVYNSFSKGTEGLATDANGDLFIAGASSTGEQELVELSWQNANFGGLPVGLVSGTAATLNFSVEAGTTIDNITVTTTGIASKDFARASGGTCVAGTYAAATTCTVNVSFRPVTPGQRQGAVTINRSHVKVRFHSPRFRSLAWDWGRNWLFKESRRSPQLG